MLVALITILFLSGGASGGLLYDFGGMKKLVKTYVADDQRKDAALDVIKDFKARAKAENKQLKAMVKQVDGELEDTAAADSELTTLGADVLASTRTYYKDLLELRFELREQFTREEWTAAYAGDSEELE
jgi:hypothetical protein